MRGRSFAAVVSAAVIVLSACGGGGGDESGADLPPIDEEYPAEQIDLGREVFDDTCSVCHGRQGGGGIGPDIRTVARKLSFDEQHLLLNTGRGAMPNFSATLSEEEVNAVIAFTRVGLG